MKMISLLEHQVQGSLIYNLPMYRSHDARIGKGGWWKQE